jgi:predicted small secreted protein
MPSCVRKLKSKSVNGDKITLKSFPSPKRGRYYAVYQNGAVVKECESKQQAQRVYKSFKDNKDNYSTGEGLFDKYSYL